jgi:hypothetical protein
MPRTSVVSLNPNVFYPQVNAKSEACISNTPFVSVFFPAMSLTIIEKIHTIFISLNKFIIIIDSMIYLMILIVYHNY